MGIGLCQLILDEERSLSLIRGDLTEEKVDVIVNAANEWLRHGAGVAGAILDKGGEIIQRQSDAWVAEHGPISHDHPAYTEAGKLPCRYVIHAVGPRWGEGYEAEKLFRTITSALKMAEQLQAGMLAIPPISTGIFGFPPAKAAPIFIKAIYNYWVDHPESVLRNIHITVIDELTSQVFLNAFHHWQKGKQDESGKD